LQGETEEQWRELCTRAVVEQDPRRLLDLITEINRLLAAKEQRLQHKQQAKTLTLGKELRSTGGTFLWRFLDALLRNRNKKN
jgi:hypothetical protein